MRKRIIRDWYHGISTCGITTANGFLITYRSHYCRSRIITARLFSPCGRKGAISITSTPRYDKGYDYNSTKELSSDALKSYLLALDLSQCGNFIAPISDGWQTFVSGFTDNKYWRRRFIIGSEYECENIKLRLKTINSLLLDWGHANQSLHGSGPQ